MSTATAPCEAPEGITLPLRGIPWYVVARETEEGLIALWDGEHVVYVTSKRAGVVRDGVIELERLRRKGA